MSPVSCELMTCPASAPPRAMPGCSLFETLPGVDLNERAVVAVSGTTRSADDTSQSEFGSCAGASSGPDVWYQLDLSRARAPLELQAVVDAGFDATVELRRGPCGDTRSVACERGRVVGSASSSVTARLEPAVYWLVIDGASDSSAGDFRLQIELDPLLACSSSAPNQSCETALKLEALDRQTLLLDEACSVEPGSDAALYYELDLSTEASPVLTQLSLWSQPQHHFQYLEVYRSDPDLPGCDTSIAYSYLSGGTAQRANADLRLLLSPGRYVIEAEAPETLQDNHDAFSIQLDRESCAAGPVGNDCAQALDLDPSAVQQTIEGSTLCNTNRRTVLPCGLEGEDAPEQLHRLDLRAAPGTTRLRASVLVDGLSFTALLYVLRATPSGECGEPLYCDDRILNAEGPPHLSLTLEPALYFVGVDGSERGVAGTYRLLVELEPAESSPCVTAQIDSCMFSAQASTCCDEWSPLCSAQVAACGLSPATQACVCAANPACCESGLLPLDCSAAQSACNYLCPDFAPSEGSCLADR